MEVSSALSVRRRLPMRTGSLERVCKEPLVKLIGWCSFERERPCGLLGRSGEEGLLVPPGREPMGLKSSMKNCSSWSIVFATLCWIYIRSNQSFFFLIKMERIDTGLGEGKWWWW
jgi:hypothetical protein